MKTETDAPGGTHESKDKETYVSIEETYISSKETYTDRKTRQIYLQKKRIYLGKSDQHIHKRDPCTYQRETRPINQPKRPINQHKRATKGIIVFQKKTGTCRGTLSRKKEKEPNVGIRGGVKPRVEQTQSGYGVALVIRID